MDVLKQKGKHCKLVKSTFKDYVKTKSLKYRAIGPAHIKEGDYGTPGINGMHPITNRYVKQVKADLKREYRATKRGEKHKLKQEIEDILTEDINS